MNWKKLTWEVRDVLRQIKLSLKHVGDIVVSLMTFNTRGMEARLEAEVDAYIERRSTQHL